MSSTDIGTRDAEVIGPVMAAIGGGHGLARTLRAARRNDWAPTAIVSVADDGGSSGRLRRDMGVIPPGDLRRALSSLCPDPVRAGLLEHRFRRGELAGHALGNLVLLAGAAQHGGDVAAGLAMLGELLGVRGRVLPVCDRPLELAATLYDGSTVIGQRHIVSTSGIRAVHLVDDAVSASAEAVTAITASDLVVIGPGSWFTSLAAALIVPGIAEALSRTSATTVVVANIRQQPGETTGMDMADHLEALFAHLPSELGIDVLVANDAELGGRARMGMDALAMDMDALAPVRGHPRVGKIVGAAVVDDAGGHDPTALAGVLRDLLADRRAGAGHDASGANTGGMMEPSDGARRDGA